MDDRRASAAVVTVGEAMEAEDEDRDLFARFAGFGWDSVERLGGCDMETAELGSDSAFLFMPVCRLDGLCGAFGGGDSKFWAVPEGVLWASCGDW